MTDDQHEAILNGEASAIRAALVDVSFDALEAAYDAAGIDPPYEVLDGDTVVPMMRRPEACPCRCHHPSAYDRARRTCPVCLCGWS